MLIFYINLFSLFTYSVDKVTEEKIVSTALCSTRSNVSPSVFQKSKFVKKKKGLYG